MLAKVHLGQTWWQVNHLVMRNIQYIPRNLHTVFALLCFVVVIHWLIFPYPSGLLHWHCGNLTIAPGQSNDCPSASKATLMNMDKYFMWIYYERLHNHNKAKHNKTVCIFLGIYCTLLFCCSKWHWFSNRNNNAENWNDNQVLAQLEIILASWTNYIM